MEIEKIEQLKASLIGLLQRLQEGDIYCIEYGDATQPPGSPMSYLRVYYISTPAGYQFGIKTVVSHIEGSGLYVPTVAEAANNIMNMVLHYHRPTPLRKVLLERYAKQDLPKPDFSFFAIDCPRDMQDSINKRNGLVAYRSQNTALPAAQTVVLSSPHQAVLNQAQALHAKWEKDQAVGEGCEFDVFVNMVIEDLNPDIAMQLQTALQAIHSQH